MSNAKPIFTHPLDALHYHCSRGEAIAGVPAPASEIFNFIGKACVVKRQGFPKVYGTLEHANRLFEISSPAGSDSFSFRADDVESLNESRVVTLKPLAD